MSDDVTPVTADEKLWAFRRATTSLGGAPSRWADRAKTGLTDEQLAEALEYELGTMGGSTGGPVGVTHQGSGLKIWADRSTGSRRAAPLLEGSRTVSFARSVYAIPDPSDRQMSLL